VRTRRDGTRIRYYLASPTVCELWAAVRDDDTSQLAVLDELATAYLGDRSTLATVTHKELAKRMRERDVIVLDVRPEPEYHAGHISGAISLPIKEITRRLRAIPKDRQVVAYCRGPYCVYADDAVRTLKRRGYEAARLEDGYPEWAHAGLPVDITEA
jgi:rhodanese-related sulfurtransferase